MTGPLQTAAFALCMIMALLADSVADKPLLLLAGVGIALGLVWGAGGRWRPPMGKKRAAPDVGASRGGGRNR